jgi:hypothetical protein
VICRPLAVLRRCCDLVVVRFFKRKMYECVCLQIARLNSGAIWAAPMWNESSTHTSASKWAAISGQRWSNASRLRRYFRSWRHAAPYINSRSLIIQQGHQAPCEIEQITKVGVA